MNVYILLLSLITGSSNSQLTGCSGGWIKFTCKDDPHNDTLPIITIGNCSSRMLDHITYNEAQTTIRIFFRLELRKPSQGWTIRKKRIIIPIIVVTLVILLLAMSLTLLVMVLKYCE
uniref:Uncharacterized protein n=1 Tax=Knipowitschia caucasica TaxID=637954 RepID=A0AAV2M849_KNICA